MGKYKFYKRSSFKFTKKERQLAIVIVVFILVFIGVFTWKFITNCIFEWPIRWDVRTCWNEQIPFANEKAIEEVIKFAP